MALKLINGGGGVGGGINLSWVDMIRKINKRGDVYSGLQSRLGYGGCGSYVEQEGHTFGVNLKCKPGRGESCLIFSSCAINSFFLEFISYSIFHLCHLEC